MNFKHLYLFLCISASNFAIAESDEKPGELETRINALENQVNELKKELSDLKSVVYIDVHGAPLEKAQLNMKGRSYGGIVREKPTMNSPKVMSLKEGQNIELIERVGEKYNGYYWFKVKTESGAIGFQWGGILCAYSKVNVGAFKNCADVY